MHLFLLTTSFPFNRTQNRRSGSQAGSNPICFTVGKDGRRCLHSRKIPAPWDLSVEALMLNRSYWTRAERERKRQRLKWWWPSWSNLGLEGSQNMGNRCLVFLSVGLSCPQARGAVICPGFCEFIKSALYLFKHSFWIRSSLKSTICRKVAGASIVNCPNKDNAP